MSHVALIRLSWPAPALSKNAGSPWGRGTQIARTKAIAAQRKEAWALALAQSVKAVGPNPRIIITAHPPDNRRRDVQNLPAMLSGALDGIADAHGQDDLHHRVSYPETWGEPVKGGRVLIEIRERDTWQHIADAARGMVQGSVK